MVVERLRHAARDRLLREEERLREVGLPREDVTVSLLRIAQGDDLMQLRRHVLGDRIHVRILMRRLRRLDRLFLQRLEDVRHARDSAIRALHPRLARVDVLLVLLVLVLLRAVAHPVRVAHRIVRRTVQRLTVRLLHELCLVFRRGVQLFLIARDHLQTANPHLDHLTFPPSPYCSRAGRASRPSSSGSVRSHCSLAGT